VSHQRTKYERLVEYTCGARGTLVSHNKERLDRDVEFFNTRKCPRCQLKEGDITETEFQILLANYADELADSLVEEFFTDLIRDRLKNIAERN